MRFFIFVCMQISDLYQLYLKHPHITTDSRKPVTNGIFIALKGDNFNGNLFALEALNSGCSYAIVDELPETIDEKIILVENSLQTLQELANYHRRKLSIPVLAITGSNGKTTTKELIARVLEKKYKIVFTPGNLNNHIGVPLTLLKMNSETEIGVVELGANHIDEVRLLSDIADPDYAVITNVGKDHLEGFGSPEGVKQAQNELYQNVIQSGGTIFINWEDPVLKELVSGKEVKLYKYGTSDECDCMGGVESFSGMLTFGFYHAGFKKHYRVSTNLYGSYNFENAICAVAIGMYFEIPPWDIVKAIELYVPQNNRSQIVKSRHNNIVLDAYNANPTSLRIAIEEFVKQNLDNKVFIIGDMFEMGQYSEDEHKSILDLLEKIPNIECYLVGNEFKKASQNRFICFSTVEELNIHLQAHPLAKKNILIKGSRGIQLERCLEYL